MNKKIFIIIPAYNEEKNIYAVLESLKDFSNIIVVDDFSSDNTYDIAKSFDYIHIIKHDKNSGYDKALNSGFKKAATLGADFMITYDADGQHLVQNLKIFIEKLFMNNHLVVGRRKNTQRFMEKIFSMITKNLYNISDPLSGMKAYSVKIYNEMGFFDNYNSIGTQLMLYAIKKKYDYCEVDILTEKRIGSSRFGGILISNYKILRSLLISFFLNIKIK